ncbi:hypothetical protein C2S53_010557 [Perilla frutescens var. hirtella]|uniref:PGG domain-containing protein n=1 Tax=Perilla frutescens var. hirtella TaxID=608512 RepID=A0AAD4IMM1_PERFH|nr:hypothetical protein C2S53_010557 [Perilla frutescens var. hirtella]
MNNSTTSEFTEIDNAVSDTQHTMTTGKSMLPIQTNSVQEKENQNCQGVDEATPEILITQPPITVQDNGNQDCEGSRSGSHANGCRRMYKAVLSSDWAAAKMLINQDPSLAYEKLNERGDRALHLSIAMKHKKFAQKLIELMEPSALELPDGCGYTACCYAAISAEMVEIAHLLVTKNPRVVAARNSEGRTPLQMASISGKYAMILFLFARTTKTECLSHEEWFALLLNAIATKMYDFALQIVEHDGSVATKRNEEGTALHLLARQELSEASSSKTAILLKSILGTTFYGRQIYGEMQPDSRHLAKKLLAKIQENLEHESDVLELLKNPPILHDAAKVGNVELIVMLTHTYPDLLWQTNYYRSIFHVAVIYRQDNVFGLIRQIGGLKNIVVFGLDEDGNNILHLAAKLGPLNSRKNIVSISALQMQRELAWFKEVEAIVPITFTEMKNRAGKKPRELFSEEHADLLRESEAWMRSTADSCMLIATIILTVVYAAAFTVPGGNNGETGLPILMRSNWFNCFFVFEALALFGSTLCIIVFWSITSSGFKEERFLDILPYQLKLGISGLFGSLIGAISAFMSAYCLVLVDERAWVVKSVILLIYVMLVLAICGRFSELWFKMKLPKYLPQMLSNRNSQNLFSGHATTTRN